MSLVEIQNIFILLSVLAIGKCLADGYNWLVVKIEHFNLWERLQKQKRDMLFQRKKAKVEEQAFNYWIDFVHTDPIIAASFLAKQTVKEKVKSGTINETFNTIRRVKSLH
jgi:hypothetical protein